MNFKIKLVVIIFVVLGFFSNLSAQNAFYDAEYLSGINLKDLYKYIIFVEHASKLSVDKKELGYGELLKELELGRKFLKKPWDSAINTKDFRKAFKEVESLYEKYERQFRNHILEMLKKEKKEGEEVTEEEVTEEEVTNWINKKIREKEDEKIEIAEEKLQPETVSPTSGKFFNSTFQSNLIDALGTLIAERFKEDVTIMYIEKFKKALKTGKYKEIYKIIEKLLPEIYNLVDRNDPFTYLSLGKEWKAAFEKDIENLPKHIVHYLKTSDFFNKESKLYPYLEFAFEISDKLINGYHPVEILNYLDILYKEKKEENSEKEFYKTFYKTIHFLNLVQLNLHKHRSGSSSNEEEFSGWVSFSDLKNLMVQKIEKNNRVTYFLALIYFQDKTFFDEEYIGKRKFLVWLKETEKLFTKRIRPFYQIMVKINEFDKKSKGTSEDYAQYMQLALDVLKETYEIISSQSTDKTPGVKRGFRIAQKCLDIYKSIYKNDYKNLISQTLFILREIDEAVLENSSDKKYLSELNANVSKEIEKLKNDKVYEDLKNKNSSIKEKIELLKEPDKSGDRSYSEKITKVLELNKRLKEEIEGLISGLEKQENRNEDDKNKCKLKVLKELKETIEEYTKRYKLQKFIGALVKYGAFIEGIANAKNSMDMKKVIAAVILPRGSFFKKRTSTFSLTIAVHPGVFIGGERLSNVGDINQAGGVPGNAPNNNINKINTREWGMVTGFTAPLGVEFCWGSKKSECFISSCGIFLSVIDLGAVVSYRLTKSSDDYNGMPDKITFKQIFSPGASLNFGIKSSPITFRVGAQYTPEIRKIKEEEIIMDEKKSWRFFAGFSWDIPLISITPKIRK